ncbi:unnamed protein product [Caenorhabditis angaria]|uniref:Carboxylic ester hydrolase n=1 Tax=Caenorhabditis angaria TaxID=860376 RepID=A0A9P1IJC7_9PELO|nr:unnamed protein product [Caenorhabditis angaria]
MEKVKRFKENVIQMVDDFANYTVQPRARIMGLHNSKHDPTEILELECGPIRGLAYEQNDGRIVDGYLGIPYAQPPINELRFKKPQKAEKWEDPLDCFQFGPRAPQNDELLGQFTNFVGKNEDNCLTLNVFAPRWTSDDWPDGLPVMVFVHGGGFSVHSSSNYGSESIARNLCVKDVLVVSINYRLGVLGFFSTGDDLCPGNMGLWDQTLALKWVQKHIEHFGGDRNNVTVFGQSAGGASTDLLCLSPHSQNLFNRAIPMAGNSQCDWAIRTKEQQILLSREYAKFIGFQGNEMDTVELLEFINEQPLYKLELGINPKRGFKHTPAGLLYFVPIIDGDFFPEPLSELRKKAPKKAYLTGTTEFEGLFFVALGGISRSSEGAKRFMKKIIKECDFGDKTDEVIDEVHDYYFKNQKGQKHKTEQVVNFIGDYSINYGTWKFVNKMTEYGNDVWFYQFDYYNPHGFGIFKWLMPFLGSTHCTEMRYILGKGLISKFRPDSSDKKMIEIMTTIFTNFAKYGNPNIANWEKHSLNSPCKFYRIELENQEMDDNYQERRVEYWDKLQTKNETRKLL